MPPRFDLTCSRSSSRSADLLWSVPGPSQGKPCVESQLTMPIEGDYDGETAPEAKTGLRARVASIDDNRLVCLKDLLFCVGSLESQQKVAYTQCEHLLAQPPNVVDFLQRRFAVLVINLIHSSPRALGHIVEHACWRPRRRTVAPPFFAAW